jgi:hypothetical protein
MAPRFSVEELFKHLNSEEQALVNNSYRILQKVPATQSEYGRTILDLSVISEEEREEIRVGMRILRRKELELEGKPRMTRR